MFQHGVVEAAVLGAVLSAVADLLVMIIAKKIGLR